MAWVRVALDVPLARLFDYRVEETEGGVGLAVGRRVIVPFGRQRLCGVVWAVLSEHELDVPPERLRAVIAVLDDTPPLPRDWRELVAFAAEYYVYPLGAAVFTALPVGLRHAAAVRMPKADAHAYWRLTPLACEPAANARRQRELWAAFQAKMVLSTAEIRQILVGSQAVFTKWKQLAWLEKVEAAAVVWHASAHNPPPVVPDLTAEQDAVLRAFAPLGTFAVEVLHGITGSGKTEVYLRRVAEVVAAGLQALVLVPEISLTPQLEQRFRMRFPDVTCVSLHSHMADGERTQNWLAAWRGEARIILGTRLAVFTPLPHLGVIIVDEEHDASFKQQEGLRYSARDLAVWRGHAAHVPVILGSATPSLETLCNVERGRYRAHRLTSRATGAALPHVRTVDLRVSSEYAHEGLSREAVEALKQRLSRGELSLVYLNRRGFAPTLCCSQCGWQAECPDCSARLVWHRALKHLRCHHCGHVSGIPPVCPCCGNVEIQPVGFGTQRLEAALAQALPEARVLRIDRDTVQHKDAWTQIYERVHRGDVDIVLGTQMLAKGHDFPLLSLVVVVNADGALFSFDYRATATLFAELTQVIGRAGRGERAGEVLIQTRQPNHPLYVALQAHDFDGYSQYLLNERRTLHFPPYVYYAVLRADALEMETALAFLQEAALSYDAMPEGVTIFEASPAVMSRIARRYRAQRVVHAQTRVGLRGVLTHWQRGLSELSKRYGRSVRWSLDVDPIEG